MQFGASNLKLSKIAKWVLQFVTQVWVAWLVPVLGPLNMALELFIIMAINPSQAQWNQKPNPDRNLDFCLVFRAYSRERTISLTDIIGPRREWLNESWAQHQYAKSEFKTRRDLVQSMLRKPHPSRNLDSRFDMSLWQGVTDFRQGQS